MPSISEAADAGQSSSIAVPDQPAEAGPSSAPQAPKAAAAPPTPAESSKPKPTKKPKGKGKVNADGIADAKPNRTSLRGGMIGIASSDPPAPAWLPAGGGARKALPELVLPFKLPTSIKGGEDGFSEGSDAEGSEIDDESSEESEAEGDGEGARRARLEKRRRKERRALQRSLLQVQALRQSRLFHLASLLAPYSRRTKAGVSYPASVSPDLLHGIEPSVKGSHILTPLSRVEVQVGPHFFAKTKLWEMRKEREPRAASPPPPKKAQQPSAPSQPSATQQSSKASQPAPAPRPVQPPPQPAAPRPTPPTAAATAAVDPVLVTRVNERASKDADLRDLLQVAARGAASPEQLRVLGEVIQDVTREMERDGLKVQPPQAIARPPPPPPVAAPAATPPPKAQTKAAKGQTKKTAASGTPGKKAAASQAGPSTESARQPEAQPTEQAQGPAEDDVKASSSASATAVAPASSFRPPILVMEFRENPSMRFYVPLWSSIVRRRKLKRVREVGEGGLEEEEELPEEPTKEQELIEFIEVQLHFLAPLPGSDAAVGTGADAKYPIVMTITAEDSNKTIWEAISRVREVRTIDASGREVFEEPKEETGEASSRADQDRKEVEDLATTIAKAIAALPPRRSLNLSAPLPRGLEDHLADKFAPQLQSTASLYSSSTSRDVHAHGSSAGAAGASKRRSSPVDLMHDDLHDLTGSGGAYDFDGSLSGIGGSGSAPKPKKKRNVATHNPDGSVKRCNSCQTNVTPMWRRGPEGPATLCNACGARWKSGRLGMPSARGRKGSAGLGVAAGAGSGDTATAIGGGTATAAGDAAPSESQRGEQTVPTSTESARVGERVEVGEEAQAASTTSQPVELAQITSATVGTTSAQGAEAQTQGDVAMAEAEPQVEAEADASANTSGIVEGTL